jgi:hypothetical protein
MNDGFILFCVSASTFRAFYRKWQNIEGYTKTVVAIFADEKSLVAG